MMGMRSHGYCDYDDINLAGGSLRGRRQPGSTRYQHIFERYRQFHSLDGKSFNLRVFCLFSETSGSNPDNHHHDVGHSSVSGFSVRSQSTKA